MTSPVQTAGNSNTGTITTCIVTLDPAGTGSCLVAYIMAFGDIASPTTVTVTSGIGGAGGSFAADNWHVAAASLGAAGADAAIWVNPDAAADTNAVKVTTNGTGTQTILVIVEEWPGLAATWAALVDKTATLRQSSNSGTWSVGPSGTTTQASEIIVACAGSWNGSTGSFTLATPGSPWTEETQVQRTSAGYYQRLAAGWRETTTTGTFTYNGTQGSGCQATAILATLKTAGGGGTTVTGGAAVAAAADPAADAGISYYPPGVSAPAAATATAAATITAAADMTGAVTAAVTCTAGQTWPADAAAAITAAVTCTGQAYAPGSGGDIQAPVTAAPAAAGTALRGAGVTAAAQATAAPAGLVTRLAAPARPVTGTVACTGDVAPHGTWTFTVAAPLAAEIAAAGAVNAHPVYMGEAGVPARRQPLPGCSQVAVAAPGSAAWTYLGHLGHVRDLKHSWVMPGGADKMSCLLQIPASLRPAALNVGQQVRVWRGGTVIWTGRMDEPQPGPDGWTLTAAGDGQRGNDFTAIYTGWPAGQPDDAVNQAIARGLPWINAGAGQPSWAWYGEPPDPGSVTIKALLDTITSRGGGTWYVNSGPGGRPGPDLTLFPIPSAVNRLLVVTTPVPRTLGADINRLVIRYQASTDNTDTSTAAAYGITTVTSAAGVAAHQATEAYLDLSQAGVMTAGAAQAAGNTILGLYQRASYAGPFTAVQGQLLTAAGQPADPGTDHAGTVIRCLIADYGYGGELTPDRPVVFPVAGYEWDDQKQAATITPWQMLNQSLQGLVQARRP